jgi:hypothetical protein
VLRRLDVDLLPVVQRLGVLRLVVVPQAVVGVGPAVADPPDRGQVLVVEEIVRNLDAPRGEPPGTGADQLVLPAGGP